MVSAGSVISAFRLLGWLFPTRPLAELTDESFAQLEQRYRRFDSRGTVAVILGFLPLTFAYFLALVYLGRWVASDVPHERFLGPLEFLYFFAALFLSLFSSGAIMCLVIRLLLGQSEYAVYMAYLGERNRSQMQRQAMHLGRVFGLFFWIGVPPIIVVMAFYLDSFVAFTDQEIVINPIWTLGSRIHHPYSDVHGVYEVRQVHLRDGDKIEPFQVVTFKDGTRWISDHGSLDPKLAHQRELARYVAEKSGQAIRRIEFEDQIPIRR